MLVDSTPSPEEDQSLPESTEAEGESEAEEIIAIDTSTSKATQRRLLQQAENQITVQKPIPLQYAQVGQPFMLIADNVFHYTDGDLISFGSGYINYTTPADSEKYSTTWLSFDKEAIFFAGTPQSNDEGTLFLNLFAISQITNNFNWTTFVLIVSNIFDHNIVCTAGYPCSLATQLSNFISGFPIIISDNETISF